MIQLVDAAKWFKGQPHQVAALNWLQGQCSADVLTEFGELFRAAPEVKRPLPPAWVTPALALIKQFEGCKLKAYKDAAGVPTIGWGTTRYLDAPVRMSDRVSQAMADELLQNDVENLFGPGLLSVLPMAKGWPAHQVAALVSWAYNVGLGAVEDSTLVKRLKAGEDRVTVVREELPRWSHAGEAVLAGLERRRAAEVELFCGPSAAPLQQDAARLTPKTAFTARITPHIRLGEFALFDQARRFTQQHQIDTAVELCNFLERVRSEFSGLPVIITSGFRPAAINRSVGGASASEHLYGQPKEGAVDFYVDGAPIKAVQDYCDRHWPYSVGYGAPKGFVHLGRRADGQRRRWDY